MTSPETDTAVNSINALIGRMVRCLQDYIKSLIESLSEDMGVLEAAGVLSDSMSVNSSKDTTSDTGDEEAQPDSRSVIISKANIFR